MKIALLIGTVRAKRESVKAAHFIAEKAKQIKDVELDFVDPQELMLVDEGEDVKDPRYTEITKNADAFIIVTPEYNHSMPGSLKRMLDSEYENYFKKPVALVGVSSGSWGGVRACEALLPVCHRLGLVPVRAELYFPKIQDKFSDEVTLKAEYNEQYNRNVKIMLDELIWFTEVLKKGREQQ
jgi:NAD(P)H-dependent FMN reductase